MALFWGKFDDKFTNAAENTKVFTTNPLSIFYKSAFGSTRSIIKP